MKLFIRTRLQLEIKTTLYYLVAQAGVLLFLCAENTGVCKIPFMKHLNFAVNAGAFNPPVGDNLTKRIGIALISLGLVQLTRSFLNTSKTLPQLDIRLAFGLAGYLVFSLVLSVANLGFFYPEFRMLAYENIFLLFLACVVICTLVSACIQKLPASGFLILAVILPMLLVSACSWAPEGLRNELPQFVNAYPVIFGQAMGFPLALVARAQLMRNKLKVKKAKRSLELSRWKTQFKYRVGELENN